MGHSTSSPVQAIHSHAGAAGEPNAECRRRHKRTGAVLGHVCVGTRTLGGLNPLRPSARFCSCMPRCSETCKCNSTRLLQEEATHVTATKEDAHIRGPAGYPICRIPK